MGVYSQNTNSPYSVIGIGDVENNFYNRTSGMANTGYSYRNERYIINNNPASYTSLQRQFFNIELSGRAQFISYSGTPVTTGSSGSKDFAIKRLSVGTKVNKWWGSGVGFAPFSTSSYGFSYTKSIVGSTVGLPATVDGNGSVNQVYWNNAFEVTKYLSVGVQTSYLFGSLNQTENLFTSQLQESLTTTNQNFLRSFYFTYGAQFYHPLAKDWNAAIGATFSNKTSLASENTITVTDNNGQLLSSDVVKDDYFKLPHTFGGGVSISHNKKIDNANTKKYTWAVDYKFQDWSSTKYSGAGFSLQDAQRISAAFEVANNLQAYNASFEKTYFQAGLYYGTSYLSINGKQLNETGVTLGYGFTAKRYPSLAGHLVLEIGQRGTTSNNLIKERFVNIGFTVSYRDLWYTKGRKYN
jgi:hypothetical protein